MHDRYGTYESGSMTKMLTHCTCLAFSFPFSFFNLVALRRRCFLEAWGSQVMHQAETPYFNAGKNAPPSGGGALFACVFGYAGGSDFASSIVRGQD